MSELSGWKKVGILAFGLGLGVLAGLLLLSVVEVGVWLFYWYPDLLNRLPEKSRLKKAIRTYYVERDMYVVQFQPDCAIYDPGLFYTLRPGTCRFKNREFDTTFRVSAQGFRDTVEEHQRPEIVVTGDSHAMGWGVAEGRTFSELLGRKLGVGIENIAVSSYATSREMIALERVHRSMWKGFVIVYSSNDVAENMAFIKNGFLRVGKENIYQDLVDYYFRHKTYYPFKLSSALLKHLLDPPPPDKEAGRNHAHEAVLFLRVLEAYAHLFAGRDVIVMEIATWGPGTDGFVAQVAKRYPGSKLQGIPRSFEVLDTSRILETDDFYRLDGHMNERGHAKIADALYERLRPKWNGQGGPESGAPMEEHP